MRPSPRLVTRGSRSTRLSRSTSHSRPRPRHPAVRPRRSIRTTRLLALEKRSTQLLRSTPPASVALQISAVGCGSCSAVFSLSLSSWSPSSSRFTSRSSSIATIPRSRRLVPGQRLRLPRNPALLAPFLSRQPPVEMAARLSRKLAASSTTTALAASGSRTLSTPSTTTLWRRAGVPRSTPAGNGAWTRFAGSFSQSCHHRAVSKPLISVNLGGWLVLEPFITPALYEPYMNATTPAVDEWTLCTNLAADASSGGVAKVIENHYNTFVVRLCPRATRKTIGLTQFLTSPSRPRRILRKSRVLG